MQVLLQSSRLKIAEEMPLTPILIRELEGFRVKISSTGAESFESWRASEHDDLLPVERGVRREIDGQRDVDVRGGGHDQCARTRVQ